MYEVQEEIVDVEKLKDEMKALKLSDSEMNAFLRFLGTFNIKEKQEALLAQRVVKYIIRQINSDSLKGVISIYDFRDVYIPAVKGLFKLIYLENYSNNLVRHDIIFHSAKNYMFLLFTRVLNGRDREILIKELEAKRPIVLGGGK